MNTYQIVRFRYEDDRNEVIVRGLTLEQAQAHCRREDTHGEGWFDGYDHEPDTLDPGKLTENETDVCAWCSNPARAWTVGDLGHLCDPICDYHAGIATDDEFARLPVYDYPNNVRRGIVRLEG